MTDDEINFGEQDECPAEELAFWDIAPIEPREFLVEEDAAPRIYDLEERTARFGEQIILFAKKIPFNPVNNRLIDQLVGAGSSVGANYCEADDSISRADFRHRIGICRKEARETKFFLRMVARACPELSSSARKLWVEVRELHLIFSRIRRTAIHNMESE